MSPFFIGSTIMEEKKMLREIANDKITPKTVSYTHLRAHET